MESSNKKAITVSFMIAGALIGLVLTILIETAVAIAPGKISRFLAGDTPRHILPALVGIAAFTYLQFNRRTLEWADDVVGEIRRVVWPTTDQTVKATLVVIIMLVVSGVVIGMFDMVAAYVIDWLLHLNF